MPHCVIEYSDTMEINSQVKTIMASVFEGTKGAGLFEIPHIKIRAKSYDFYQVGEEDKAFIHINAMILSGRTIAQKKLLSESILSQLSQLNLSNVVITVDVVDMESSCYVKLSY